jgi:Flp pilus assembly protein TadB
LAEAGGGKIHRNRTMDSTESTATDGQQTADLKEFEEKQSNDNFKWTRTTPSIIAVGLFFWIVALFWKSLLFRLIALTFTFGMCNV